MTISLGRAFAAATLLFLALAAPVHAGGLWDDLRKQVEDEIRRSPAEAVKILPQPVQEAATQAARTLGHFSPEEEQAIGRQAAGNLLGAAPLVNDPKLQQYVNLVGRWLSLQSARPDLAWHFGVIESADVNAFAAPGGYVFVTRGLYRQLQSESELAGVLAHEIAHIVSKHHLKLLAQGQLLDQGGKLLSEQAGESEQIARMIGSGAELFSRSLDQKAEYEADSLAMVLAARAGYDPFGLPMVLQDLGHLSSDDRSVSLLFKTHPHPDQRLEHLEKTGQRLDGIYGRVNQNRFYRLQP
ncbi:M48 family metalloprotease [Accumulibacter sp.]|uniref:M48 family metalloprotease n=1 Tax=Accumulibacter sp. TaxID=2053492 RepID=UPI0028C37A07|nr:M48 family metalloprotease [Accumulibacter sp.]